MRSFKLVFLGSTSVGKTALVRRIVLDTFEPFAEPTIGACFSSKQVVRPDREVRLEIWDTAGQERYNSLAPTYYRGADVALVVYDLTDGESYSQALTWVQRLKTEALSQCIICLIGTKADLVEPDEYGTPAQFARATPRETVDEFVRSSEIYYYETSAKTGAGVRQMLDEIADRCPRVEQFDGRKKKTVVDLDAESGNSGSRRGRCC